MGPRAIRYLGRAWASKNLLRLDSVKERQAAAALILGGLGSDAAPALPSLVRMFRRSNLSGDEVFAVSATMAQIAPDKLEFLTPELIADLNAPHPNGESRLVADISLLNAIGPKAKSAIPSLWPIARRGDILTMPAAAVAIWNISRDTNALIECLSNSLSHHGKGARSFLYDLGECVPLPNFLAPLLEQALRHPEPSVRQAAEHLLNKIDPGRLHQLDEELNRRQDELLQNHLKLLQSTNALDRSNAARALQFFGPKAAAAAPRLVEILKLPQQPSDRSMDFPGDKMAALWTLQFIGSNAAAVTPDLIGLLRDSRYVPQICDILANIGPGATAAIPALQVLLATNYVLVTNKYGGAPGPVGSPRAFHQEIVPRWKVAQALASIDSQQSNAIAILREAQATQPRPVRGRYSAGGMEREKRIPAAITLWKLGLEANPPVDELIAKGDGWAFDRLADIGPGAKKALPVIEATLKQNPLSADAVIAICLIDPEEAKRLGLPGLFIICPDAY